MRRALAVILAGALLAPAALGAPPRSKLDGVNGVSFGATFDAARAKLGAAAKADTDPSDPKIRILLVSGLGLFGEKASFNYTFDAQGKFSEAYAVADVPTGNFAVCSAHWTSMFGQMTASYGAPDTYQKATLPNQTPSETAVFKFGDGSHIDADQLGCLIEVSFYAPGR
ncbi:MAG TPA: hypothetical protein VG942_16190 [Hyphomonadaceae bacterium]|nr:hypothetical protein [Hyphomonadaceae bacterium]